jgi:HlyD family secretion protein
LGKTYTQGVSIGTIDVMKGYKLVADVDEFYLDKIKINQKGSVEFNGKTLDVQIVKIIKEIKSGQFQVEVNFLSTDNIDLQQGLSFSVRLNLSEKVTTKLLSKGSFNQETAGKWIFVVNGNFAERKAIKLGRENPLYYEVLDGLKVGDKVITSSYKDYTDIEVLNLE